MKTNNKNIALWVAVAVLGVALVVTYVSLTFKIQDTEKRLVESLHGLRLEVENLR